MAERKLAIEAGQQIEPEDRDGIDHRERELENEEILHHERQHDSDRDGQRRSDGGADYPCVPPSVRAADLARDFCA